MVAQPWKKQKFRKEYCCRGKSTNSGRLRQARGYRRQQGAAALPLSGTHGVKMTMGGYGSSGYKGKNEQAKVGDVFHGGRIQYHLRDGTHYLSCADWRVYMEMIRRNRQEGG